MRGAREATDASATNRQDEILSWATRNGAAWLDKGIGLLDDGQIFMAIDLIESGAILLPKNRRAITARRMLHRALREDVRSSFKNGDYHHVIAITAQAHRNRVLFPDSYLHLGRAATAIGDIQAAREALQRAAELPGPTVRTLVLFARASVKSEAYRDALSTYKQVIRLAEPDDPALKEATHAPKKLQSRAFRSARESIELHDYQAAWSLLGELASIEGTAEKARGLRNRVLANLRRSMREIEPDDEQGRHSVARRILDL